MANRNKSYDEVLAKKFENRDYAKGYLLNIVESEGLSVDEALRETIKAMGLQSFSDKSGLSIQAVSQNILQRSLTLKLSWHLRTLTLVKSPKIVS